jgi:hypothetical protein
VVLVNVSYSPTGEDRLKQPTDAPMMGTPEPGWDKLSPDLGTSDKDILITKRQWGAFYGTALDLHLRRRGITTIAIGGIATNFGVESSARTETAWADTSASKIQQYRRCMFLFLDVVSQSDVRVRCSAAAERLVPAQPNAARIAPRGVRKSPCGR